MEVWERAVSEGGLIFLFYFWNIYHPYWMTPQEKLLILLPFESGTIDSFNLFMLIRDLIYIGTQVTTTTIFTSINRQLTASFLLADLIKSNWDTNSSRYTYSNWIY